VADLEKTLQYKLGNIEGKLSALDAKMDIMLVFAEGARKQQEACRDHCDAAMPRLDKKIDEMRWRVAAVAGAEIALIGAIIWIIKAHVG